MDEELTAVFERIIGDAPSHALVSVDYDGSWTCACGDTLERAQTLADHATKALSRLLAAQFERLGEVSRLVPEDAERYSTRPWTWSEHPSGEQPSLKANGGTWHPEVRATFLIAC